MIQSVRHKLKKKKILSILIFFFRALQDPRPKAMLRLETTEVYLL